MALSKEEMRRYKADFAKKRRAKLRAANKCVQCGVPMVTKHLECPDCMRNTNIRLTARRTSQKIRAVKELFGGKCHDCGFKTDVLGVYDFHHPDPTSKADNYATIFSWTWEKIVVELAKCIMLCSNCHRIRHQGDILWQLPWIQV